jgi:hypothetical protein
LADLIGAADLPNGFVRRREFIRVVELGLTKLEPWWILEGELLRARNLDPRQRYPTRALVPFARRDDNYDVLVGTANAAISLW